MGVQTLDGLLAQGVRGQRVFVRADLNVPLRDGAVADDSRLCASLPTLRRLCEAGARVIVASHLGRPKGQRMAALSLRPVAARLAKLLGAGVAFCDECVGESARSAIDELGDGRVLLLENLRFHAGEERNDPDFSKALAALADVYVNDAFGTAHRAHASTVGMAAHFDRVAAGDLMNSELRHLQVVCEPSRPLLVILGGAKVSDKLSVLEALAPHADVLAIGGAMAYTFIAANGGAAGNSLVEPDRFGDALAVQRAARDAGRRLLLPSDHVVADRFEADAPSRVVAEIPDG
ncbi:MAG: phosphoglycerate kinase, partial [Deltaproteobacteria bacterium]|nr:phosphoglycerate kinase [Deltaproteobacteria bacterium]